MTISDLKTQLRPMQQVVRLSRCRQELPHLLLSMCLKLLECLLPGCPPDTISLASCTQPKAWALAIQLSPCQVLHLLTALHLLPTATVLSHQFQKGTSLAPRLKTASHSHLLPKTGTQINPHPPLCLLLVLRVASELIITSGTGLSATPCPPPVCLQPICVLTWCW